MHKINIKALSVNNAWNGRRFKTQAYKDYETELYYQLPEININKNEKLSVHYIFGLSNCNADGDNCIKQFQDIISKKYKFNDKNIYKWLIEKKIVKKGDEYISFLIEKL